jgi:hypothetical protein
MPWRTCLVWRQIPLGSKLADNVVEEMLEMYRAMDSGLLAPAERRTRETTTPTTLERFAREVLAPLASVPAGSHA